MNERLVTDEILIRKMIAEDLDQVHAIDQISFNLPWSAKAYHYD